MNGVLNMKSDFKKIFRKRILPTVLAVLALSVCSITAFAVGEDDPQTPDPQPDPVVTEYVPDETEPQYTEPIYTEPVYTEAPTTEYVEPETEEPTTSMFSPKRKFRNRKKRSIRISMLKLRRPIQRNFRLRQSQKQSAKKSIPQATRRESFRGFA